MSHLSALTTRPWLLADEFLVLPNNFTLCQYINTLDKYWTLNWNYFSIFQITNMCFILCLWYIESDKLPKWECLFNFRFKTVQDVSQASKISALLTASEVLFALCHFSIIGHYYRHQHSYRIFFKGSLLLGYLYSGPYICSFCCQNFNEYCQPVPVLESEKMQN
jgi:hypothetical protein